METTTAPKSDIVDSDTSSTQDTNTETNTGAADEAVQESTSPIMMFRRSTTNKMLGGVCGGIAEQFNVDVTLVRAAAVLGSLMGGVVVPFYIAAWLVIPAEGSEKSELEKLLR